MTRKRIGLAGAAVTVLVVLGVLLGTQSTTHKPRVQSIGHALGGAGTDPAYRGPLTRHGGPVQSAQRVVLVYWGAVWRTGVFQQQVRAAESAMLAKLPGSAWLGVLGQYGIHSIRLAGTVIQEQPPAGKVSYKLIQADLLKASQQAKVKPGLDVLWVVFPPPAADLSGFRNECGEHDDWKHGSQQYVYALVQPFDTQEYGSGPASCVQYDAYGKSLVGATTSLTSHELIEGAEDPLSQQKQGGYWSDPAAKRFGQGAAEGGDVCYGQAVQPWGSSGPVVQALYSNLNAGSEQKLGCVASLAGGAPVLVGASGARLPMGSLAPLPASLPAARARLDSPKS